KRRSLIRWKPASGCFHTVADQKSFGHSIRKLGGKKPAGEMIDENFGGGKSPQGIAPPPMRALVLTAPTGEGISRLSRSVGRCRAHGTRSGSGYRRVF